MDDTHYNEAIADNTAGSVSSDFSVFNKKHHESLLNMFTMQHKEKYVPAIIAACYSLQGLPLREYTIKEFGEEFDTRLSYILAIRSGNWKKGFERLARKFCNATDYRFAKLVSLHPEQLIGKNQVASEKDENGNSVRVVEEMEGYFRDDFLLAGDALPLLNSKDNELSRNYFIQAWDEYGQNEVTKKLIDHRREEGLRFCPEFVSWMFVQDKPIFKDNVDTGLVRKSQIIYVDAPEVDEETYLNRALNKAEPNYDYIIEIAQKAKNASKMSWVFSEESHKVIAKRAYELKREIEAYSEKGKDYASMLQFGIQNNICKYAAILAAAYVLSIRKGTELVVEVTPEICQAASEDYALVLMASFEHWLNYVQDGSVSILSRWESYVRDELKSRNALNEESAISGIPTFLGEIADNADISISTLYGACRNLKAKGIIEMRQVGKGVAGKVNSKMWLLK